MTAEREIKNAEFSRIDREMRQESTSLREKIDSERTERVKTTDDLYNQLISVVNALQDSIKQEREDRELCEEGLI